MMFMQKILSVLALILLISGCFETEEEAAARRTQFNGKTVAQVTAVIGKPIAQDKSKAIWQYNSTYTRNVPIKQYVNGKAIIVGYRSEQVNINCTYTASLHAGRVKTSNYEGNRCGRYAPKRKKK